MIGEFGLIIVFGGETLLAYRIGSSKEKDCSPTLPPPDGGLPDQQRSSPVESHVENETRRIDNDQGKRSGTCQELCKGSGKKNQRGKLVPSDFALRHAGSRCVWSIMIALR